MIPEHIREEIQHKLDSIPVPERKILLSWLLGLLVVLDILLIVLAVDDRGWKPLVGMMIAICTIWGAITTTQILDMLFPAEWKERQLRDAWTGLTKPFGSPEGVAEPRHPGRHEERK